MQIDKYQSIILKVVCKFGGDLFECNYINSVLEKCRTFGLKEDRDYHHMILVALFMIRKFEASFDSTYNTMVLYMESCVRHSIDKERILYLESEFLKYNRYNMF